ncbi:hypothetical protein ACFQ0Q_42960 [Streptomyces aureus]
MAQVYLRRLSRWQAEQQREAVADVYVSAYHGAAGTEYRDRQGFLTRFEKHGQRPDFDMVVADSGGLVGCLYGYRADRTGDWWAGFGVTCRPSSRNSPLPAGPSSSPS